MLILFVHPIRLWGHCDSLVVCRWYAVTVSISRRWYLLLPQAGSGLAPSMERRVSLSRKCTTGDPIDFLYWTSRSERTRTVRVALESTRPLQRRVSIHVAGMSTIPINSGLLNPNMEACSPARTTGCRPGHRQSSKMMTMSSKDP